MEKEQKTKLVVGVGLFLLAGLIGLGLLMMARNVNLASHFMLAVIFAGTMILLSIGLNMVYSVMKFSNFAHAEWITLGMYMSWWILQILSYLLPWDDGHYINNIFIHATYAFILVGLFGVACEILVYSKLRDKKASLTTLTVASIGIGLVARNLLSMIFSDFPQKRGDFGGLCPKCTFSPSFPDWLPSFLRPSHIVIKLTGNHPIFGTQSIFITIYEFYTIIIAIIVVIAIDLLFRYTKFGIAMRATSDNMELAQVSGINTTRIIIYTWFLAGGITGLGAAFVRANQPKFNSFDGFFLLLPIFAVVILGGVGSFRGGIIAAVILAFSRQIAIIVLTELQKPGGFGFQKGFENTLNLITFAPSYADAIGFVILIVVLLFRPQGILGKIEATRERV